MQVVNLQPPPLPHKEWGSGELFTPKQPLTPPPPPTPTTPPWPLLRRRRIRTVLFQCKRGCTMLVSSSHCCPAPTASWSQGPRPHAASWMGRIRPPPLLLLVVVGGWRSRWRGSSSSCLLFFGRLEGEQWISLIEGGEGDLSGRTAGRQRASHPPCPGLSCPGSSMYTHSAINWHGPRLKYLPGAYKQKKREGGRNGPESKK